MKLDSFLYCKFNRSLFFSLSGLIISAVPSLEKFSGDEDDCFPGEVIFESGNITLNVGRGAVVLKVVNKADRPIQVNRLCLFSCIGLVMYLLSILINLISRSSIMC